MNVYIYKDWEWEPWSNTIAYYPLESNGNDFSWNSRNGTEYNMTYTTKDWILCAYFNWSDWYIGLPWFWTLSSLTVSLWTNSSYSWSASNTPFSTWPTTDNANFQIYNNADEVAASRWNWSNSDYQSTHTDWTDWIWHNIIVTNWNSWFKIYIDSVLKANSNVVRTVKSDNGHCFIWYWTSWWWIYYLWYISNVIVEDKVWEAQEVQDYYDSIKSLYWIS